MRDMLVLTIIGADRTGLVDSLAREIAAVGGNWEESRLVRLAGQFAGVLLVTIETDRTDQLVSALRKLDEAGLQVSVHPTASPASAPPPSSRCRLEVTGNDRPGIVRDIARILAERNVNVEELESRVESAAMSGDRMFTARIRLVSTSATQLAELRARLEALAGELMVDLTAE
ncbi:MAG: ACT domain-containing protein [Myxococcota bacterium]|nr:ACT domain-containing protein [Myxococcota bacterium]